jgi:hypothetical protein
MPPLTPSAIRAMTLFLLLSKGGTTEAAEGAGTQRSFFGPCAPAFGRRIGWD